MRRFLRTGGAAVVLALCCGLPLASAQEPDTKDLHPGIGGGSQPSAQLAPTGSSDNTVERPPPTLSVLVAVLSAAVVLCIICMPSRKAESATDRR